MQVGLGDRVEGFKVKGGGFKKLVDSNDFLHLKNHAIVLKFTKPLVYTVKGKAPYGIGVSRKPNSDKSFYVVSKVLPVGSMQQWNKEFPDMQVSIGDVLREVDGVKGNACEVHTMLASDPDEEKEIWVFHYPDMV